MNIRQLIEDYFNMDLLYTVIVEVLFLNHDINISLRQVKRHLKEMGLARRGAYSSTKSLFTFLDFQIAGRGSLHGYRWMHQQCKAKGLKVKREHVRLMLNTIDPVGLQLRSKRRLKRREYYSGGPNFCWHMDSYDKLKKYGLCINGCIDGYSRKLVWLKVGRTSSNPRVIARYFVEAIKEHQGHPRCIRGDLGTENGLVAAMQTFLSAENENVSKPFIYGKSTMNTRIESFWCILRRKCCQIWIDELKDLLNNGDFTGDILDINLIQFCFMKLLQVSVFFNSYI